MRSALGAALAAAMAVTVLGCGGGRTAVIGFGNSGNRILENGMLGEVADALAALPGTPEVTDAMVAEIFASILERAHRGDPEAALIVLLVAEEQRGDAEGG
jgi:hypothetical protein